MISRRSTAWWERARARCSRLGVLTSTAIACSTAPSQPPSEPPDAGRCTARDGGTATRDGSDDSPADAAAPGESGPSLSTLSVTGATLLPDFSPDIHDYYVRCAGPTNTLGVAVKAAPGASSSISVATPGGARRGVGSSAPRQMASLSVAVDDAIVVTVNENMAGEEYWIRCVPPAFPELQWTTRDNGCVRSPGFYLIGTMTGAGGWAIVLDTNGVPVWYERGAADSGNPELPIYDVETLRSGFISFYSTHWHDDHLNPWRATPLARGACPGRTCEAPDEHELRVLANGHYVGLSSVREAGVDLTGINTPAFDGGVVPWGSNATIDACNIIEFDSTGKLFWSWKATDHFIPAKAWTYLTEASSGMVAEPFHCNSIDIDPANGNLLVSARHMDSVFYVEKTSGRVLWKMGGAGADCSLDSPPFRYVPVADPFYRQHDARLLPGWTETRSGGSGQISVFDDETGKTNGSTSVPARAVIYDVNVGGRSGATLAWAYENWQGNQSSSTGSFRVSPDGSRIIGWGQNTLQGELLFTEVDDKGKDLLDLICPDRTSSYRAIKVPLDAFDIGVLRKTSAL